MDEFCDLTSQNVLIYAIKAYESPICVKSELSDDLKHFSYVRRLLRRYRQYGELRERLILNHIVILYNIFGVPAATRLLFYYTRPEDYAILKTFLVFLSYMPERVDGINGTEIVSSNLQVDSVIVDALRKIKAQ